MSPHTLDAIARATLSWLRVRFR